MKITNAWIDDPSLRGELSRPGLCVEVTEQPDVTIEPEAFSGGWTVGKFGPFVQYRQHDPGAMFDSPVDAADFNVRFRNRFPVVVDVTLFVQHNEDGTTGYSLPLTRARQLVRKYDPNWRLLVSDRAAENGELLWLPVETNPECRYWLEDSKICGQRPSRLIRVSDVDLAMCEGHVRLHNERHAAKRTARAAS